jgi:endogenous inhibitor of DNA gyrase (YacG/DUF329 family)
MTDVQCPSCGSKRLRPSQQMTPVERMLELFGVVPLRCRDCDERFRSGILNARNWSYAKCPRCYRMDLTTWKREKYRINPGWKLKLALGAKPFRCESCRHNFVSFRRLHPAAGAHMASVTA